MEDRGIESRYSFYRIRRVNPESERTTEIYFLSWVGFEPTTSWSTVQRVIAESLPLSVTWRASITIVTNILSYICFRLAYLELTLTYSDVQLRRRNGVLPNVLIFLVCLLLLNICKMIAIRFWGYNNLLRKQQFIGEIKMCCLHYSLQQYTLFKIDCIYALQTIFANVCTLYASIFVCYSWFIHRNVHVRSTYMLCNKRNTSICERSPRTRFDEDWTTAKRSAHRLERKYCKSPASVDRQKKTRCNNERNGVLSSGLRSVLTGQHGLHLTRRHSRDCGASSTYRCEWLMSSPVRHLFSARVDDAPSAYVQQAKSFVHFFMTTFIRSERRLKMPSLPVKRDAVLLNFQQTTAEPVISLIRAVPNERCAFDPTSKLIVNEWAQLVASSLLFNRSVGNVNFRPSHRSYRREVLTKKFRSVSNITFLS